MVIGSLLLVTPQAHGVTIVFKSKVNNSNAGQANPFTIGPITPALGDALVVTVEWFGTGATATVTDSQGNVYTKMVQSSTADSSGPNTAIFTAIASAASADTITVSFNIFKIGMGAVLDYSGVGSFGQTSSQQLDAAGSSGTTSVTLTNVATTSWIVENVFYETGGISGSVSASNGQNLRDTMSGASCNQNGLGFCLSFDVPAPSSSFTLSETYSSNNCNVPGCLLSHSAVELATGAPGSIQTVTQCFGNCGTPAVTLANTNSTHTVNFNQSITLFYQVQVPITGYMLNVTTNLAKNLPSGFNSPFLAFYIANCPVGVPPGTSQCPFVQQTGGQTGQITKGRASIAGGVQYPVVAGTWLGIAVSAQIAPLDLNDTNTNVQMLQTSGIIPATISQDTVFSAGTKIGLWTWIQGTTITSLPPPAPSGACTNNFAQLDCLIPGMVNGMCTVVTASCQTSGALFWIIILTFLSFLVATIGFSSAHITKFVGAGEVFMFLFLGWFFIFVGVGVLESFVVIFFLFIGSVAFAKTARNYF